MGQDNEGQVNATVRKRSHAHVLRELDKFIIGLRGGKMLFIKKKFKLLFALTLCISLVACTGNGETDSTSSISTPTSETSTSSTDLEEKNAIQKVLKEKEEVNISFWTSTSQLNFPYLEAMVEAFEEEYPNIKVELSQQGAVSDLMDKLTQNIVSKTTPTLSNLSPTYFSEYINSGAIIDLMPYYDDQELGFSDEEKEAFFSFYIDEAMSFGEPGTMYCFPTNKKTADVLFYNKSYFDEQGWSAPVTWDEVVAYSNSIQENTGMPGFSYDVAYEESAFKLLSMQFGSPYIDGDGTPSIDNEASRQALNFYKDNFDAGYFTLPSEMPSAGGNYSNKGFVVGECYMFVGAAAGVSYSIPKEESGQTLFEVGIAPIPQKDTNNEIAFSKGEDYCIFSNSTEEERVAAYLLIKFLSRDDQNVDWLIHTGNLPITSTILDMPEYKAFLEVQNDGSEEWYKAAAVNAALEMNDYMSCERVSASSAALATACGTMWKSVIIGGADIENALAEVVK